VVLVRDGRASNALQLRVAVPMAAELHPVAIRRWMRRDVYATFSGERGQSVRCRSTPLRRDFEMRPFVRGILNATGLAFDAEG